MTKDLVNNTKWMVLIGAIVCTVSMFSQRVEYIGITVGSSILAASLFACFTALHLHDLRSKDNE